MIAITSTIAGDLGEKLSLPEEKQNPKAPLKKKKTMVRERERDLRNAKKVGRGKKTTLLINNGLLYAQREEAFT